MFCVQCGTDIPATAGFCPGCGRTTGPSLSGAAAAELPGQNAAYAGFWLRVVAALIDSLLVIPILFIAGIAFAGWFPNPDERTLSEDEMMAIFAGVMILSLVSAVAGWLYYTLMESSSHQATLGKKILGLRVTTMDGGRISFGRANGRYFGKMLSGMALYIGFIMAGLTERKQALHDIIAGCLVVRKA